MSIIEEAFDNLRKFLCRILNFFSKLLGCEPSPPAPQVGRIEFTVFGPVSEQNPVSPPSQAARIEFTIVRISEQGEGKVRLLKKKEGR